MRVASRLYPALAFPELRDNVKVVMCFEVSVSNGIDQKLTRYARAWIPFDGSSDWELVLFDVDQHGVVRAVDLFAALYGPKYKDGCNLPLLTPPLEVVSF